MRLNVIAVTRWPRTALLAALVVLSTGPVGAGGQATDVGGRGDAPAQAAGGVIRVDRAAMGALQRMMQGGESAQSVQVSAKTQLAVRSEPFFGQNIVGNIPADAPFTIIARDQAWFRVNFNGMQGWVYVTFMESPEGAVPTVPGAIGAANRIKQEAYNIVNVGNFPYASGTQGGVLGCAQVVSTILRNAGAIDAIDLAVDGVLAKLRQKRWRQVQPPPYRDGDVVTWNTTGSPNSHIGVIVIEGGRPFAINNSSSRLRPVKVELRDYNYPISTVMRMEGM